MTLNQKRSNRFSDLYNFAKENITYRPYKFSNIFKYATIDFDFECDEENISYNDCILLIDINEIYKNNDIIEIIKFNIIDGIIILYKTEHEVPELFNLFTKTIKIDK